MMIKMIGIITVIIVTTATNAAFILNDDFVSRFVTGLKMSESQINAMAIEIAAIVKTQARQLKGVDIGMYFLTNTRTSM